MEGGRPRRRRISYSTVGVFSAAILAVYAAGYLRTEDAAGRLETAASTPPPGGETPATAHFRDGRYTETGSGPHGQVTVEVVVQGGQVTVAAVSRCTTQYPCSDVAPLQAEVIASQSAQVDVVSRATDSSIAYLAAVRAVLERAQA